MKDRTSDLQFLLLQVRNDDDPMREQEVRCFARTLRCHINQVRVLDLLAAAPTVHDLQACDAVLLGGSGDYSVVEGGAWLPAALAAMRELVEWNKPTFGSCWGFQAMTKALGGEVVTDRSRAELGSVLVRRTEAAANDPVFCNTPVQFLAQMGHQDVVTRLPENAVLLASSGLVEHQAFRLKDKPIYCTQFHPELYRHALIERVEAYPQYVERIAGLSVTQFESEHCLETPTAEQLLVEFVDKCVIASEPTG